MNKTFGLLWIIASMPFFSCRNKITITRSYIYCSCWGKGDYQGFEIAKIKLKDSSISVFDEKFNHYSLNEHIIDSSFCYHHFSVDEGYDSKSFFDKINKGVVWRRCNNAYEERTTLGLLELNNWYVISGLYGTEDFYIYVDNNGGTRVYSLGPTNW